MPSCRDKRSAYAQRRVPLSSFFRKFLKAPSSSPGKRGPPPPPPQASTPLPKKSFRVSRAGAARGVENLGSAGGAPARRREELRSACGIPAPPLRSSSSPRPPGPPTRCPLLFGPKGRKEGRRKGPPTTTTLSGEKLVTKFKLWKRFRLWHCPVQSSTYTRGA